MKLIELNKDGFLVSEERINNTILLEICKNGSYNQLDKFFQSFKD